MLRVIDSSLDQPWCRPIATHLGHFHVGVEADVRRSRRYALARRLAGLFANYAEQRPLLLAQWQAGQQSDGAAWATGR
ncbi:MAG: exodeoxyribonuclease V subunit gamma [Marmoricola sp.]